jgi:hypothetical protein
LSATAAATFSLGGSVAVADAVAVNEHTHVHVGARDC